MLRRSKPQIIRLPAGPVPPPSRIARLLPRHLAERFSLPKQRRLSQRGVTLLVAAAAFISSTAAANPPMNSGLEQFGAKVSDKQLGDMRGKFVRPGNISYFGISMATSWQNSDQITTSAILLFSVAFAQGAGQMGGANPTVAVAWNRDCSGCSDPAMDVAGFGPAAQGSYLAVTASSQLIPVGGLDSVHGAVQTQQIAGTDNRVTNAMQLAVVPSSMAHQMDTSQLHALSQSTAEDFADGSALGFIVSANQLGISMVSADGKSALRQGVDGTLNQASQHVLLGDNFNSISNAMTITIGVDGPAKGQGLPLDGALSALKDRY